MTPDPAGGEQRRIHVVQGAHAVSDERDVCLTTVLGSCVAACIWDPTVGIGGMNHFLLPEAPDGASADKRYGVHAMELLINALLSRGARRERCQAKVFGGARMSTGMIDIGSRNAEFIRRFLSDEDIVLTAESLGGDQARRVQFWPVGGRARQHRVAASQASLSVPAARPLAPVSSDLELF